MQFVYGLEDVGSEMMTLKQNRNNGGSMSVLSSNAKKMANSRNTSSKKQNRLIQSANFVNETRTGESMVADSTTPSTNFQTNLQSQGETPIYRAGQYGRGTPNGMLQSKNMGIEYQ